MSIADRIFEDGIMQDESSRTDLNFGDRYCRGDEEQYCYNKAEDKFETINEKNEKMGRMKEEFMQMRLEEQDQTYITMQEIAQEAKDIMEKHHPIGQERYVDEAEFERNEIIDSMRDEFMSIREQEYAENEYNSYMSERPEEQEINTLTDIAEQYHNNNQSNLKMKKVEEAVMVKETKEETLKRLFLANGLVKEDVHKDPRGFVIIKRSGIDKIVSRQNIQVAYEPVKMDTDWVVIRATASMRTGTGEYDVRNMMSFGEAADNNLMGGAKKFPVAMAEKRAMSRVVLKISGFYEQGVFGQDEMAD